LSEVLNVTISYESSKKVTALAKQIFLATANFVLRNPKYVQDNAGHFFEEESEWFALR